MSVAKKTERSWSPRLINHTSPLRRLSVRIRPGRESTGCSSLGSAVSACCVFVPSCTPVRTRPIERMPLGKYRLPRSSRPLPARPVYKGILHYGYRNQLPSTIKSFRARGINGRISFPRGTVSLLHSSVSSKGIRIRPDGARGRSVRVEGTPPRNQAVRKAGCHSNGFLKQPLTQGRSRPGGKTCAVTREQFCIIRYSNRLQNEMRLRS